MKLKILLISAVALLANPIFASQGAPVGQSTLKLEDAGGVRGREIRKEIGSISTQITELDEQITEARTQALTARGLTGATSTTQASFEGQANALEMQQSQLKAQREKLQSELKSQE